MPTISGARLTRRVLIRATPAIRRAFLHAVAATLNGTTQPAIEAELRKGDLDAALDAVPWDRLASPIVQGELLDAFTDAYRAAGRVSIQAVDRAAPFIITDERPLAYLRAHGADLVTKFGLTNREALRSVLARHLEAGSSPQEMARAVKQNVGLTKPFAAAVENLRASGAPVSQIGHYAEELRALRAMNIAQTETAIALGEGQREAWNQAADRGLMDRGRAVRIWRTSRDEVVRDEHVELEGQPTGLDQPYTVPSTGRQITGPPDGVNCRCTEDLVPQGLGR